MVLGQTGLTGLGVWSAESVMDTHTSTHTVYYTQPLHTQPTKQTNWRVCCLLKDTQSGPSPQRAYILFFPFYLAASAQLSAPFIFSVVRRICRLQVATAEYVRYPISRPKLLGGAPICSAVLGGHSFNLEMQFIFQLLFWRFESILKVLFSTFFHCQRQP